MIDPVSYTVGMAMGTRRGRTRQATMWVPTADLSKSAGHPFYERLNRVLDEAALFSAAAARLRRRVGLGTGNRVARRRFAEHPRVLGLRGARGAAGPVDTVAHASPD